jgi:hypothetical protein
MVQNVLFIPNDVQKKKQEFSLLFTGQWLILGQYRYMKLGENCFTPPKGLRNIT